MPVFDESSRQEFIDMQELKNRLFEAKWEWYKAQKFGQTKVVTKEMAEEATIADDYDKWMTRRVEFMYDYLDFDNERAQIRNKFLDQMHKKSSLKDIGDKLDEFILSRFSETNISPRA